MRFHALKPSINLQEIPRRISRTQMMVDDNWISNAPIFNYLRHPYRNMANYKKIMSEKDIAVDENISKLT